MDLLGWAGGERDRCFALHLTRRFPGCVERSRAAEDVEGFRDWVQFQRARWRGAPGGTKQKKRRS